MKKFLTVLLLCLLASTPMLASATYQFTRTGAEIEVLHGIVEDIGLIDGLVKCNGNDTCIAAVLGVDYLGAVNVDDTPVDGATTAPVSSNWAYDHASAVDPHPGVLRPESEFDTQAEMEAIWQVSLLTTTGDGTDLSVSLADCTDLDCTADEMLDSVNISPASGAWDLSQLTITYPSGGWYFADENTSPDTAGQLKYDNVVAGLDDGALVWYDDDEIKYLLDYADLPTINGQILKYNATTDKWVPTQETRQKCTTALGVTASSDWAIERFPFAITITDIYIYQNGATNVIGGLDECTGTNGTCGSVTAVDSDITGTDGNEVQDDGTLTNGGIASGNRIMWHTTSVSGTNTDIQICFDYTID